MGFRCTAAKCCARQPSGHPEAGIAASDHTFPLHLLPQAHTQGLEHKLTASLPALTKLAAISPGTVILYTPPKVDPGCLR